MRLNRSLSIMTAGLGVLFLSLVPSASAAELTYTDNLLAWYSADAGVFTTTTSATPSGNEDPVGSWVDQSGNGHHLRRGTGNSTPTLQSFAGPLGTPALYFDGNDYLLMSSDGTASAGAIQYLPAATTIGTAFIVFKPYAEVTAASPPMVLTSFSLSYYIESITLGAQSGLIVDELIAARKRQWTGTAWQNTATGVGNDGGARSISSTEYTFLSVTHGVDTFDFRFTLGGDSLTDLDHSIRPSDPFGPHNDPLVQLTLQVGNSSSGGSTYLKGHLVEILLYTTELDDTQRALVEGYLNEKYVIGPPAGSLYLFGSLP